MNRRERVTHLLAPKIVFVGFLLLVLNSGYLAVSGAPTLIYLANVALYVVAGALLILAFLWYSKDLLRLSRPAGGRLLAWLASAGVGAMIGGMGAGVALMIHGNLTPQRWLLYLQIGLVVAAITLLALAFCPYPRRLAPAIQLQRAWGMALGVIALSLILPAALLIVNASKPEPYAVNNPPLPPYSQDDEGMFGKDGPFHPASLETTTRGRIPSTFCMTSQRCADCHADIFRQWSESAHRFSSFNNQWYRKSVDGWVNIARSRLQEGQVEGAQEVLRKALELDPDLPKAHFFYALALKADGEYEAALTHLRRAAAHYPEDRVVRNQMGRILFLYNLMLSYRGVGNLDLGQGHEGLYRRFKADESAQVIAAVGRRRHPEADNEAQPVHQHHSIPLPLTTTADRPKTGG